MVEAVCFIGVASCSVEAVGANAAFRKPDAIDKMLNLAELQCGQFESARDFLDHALIFGSAGFRV